MLVKTKAIVISSVKYQEKSLIVKCFTLSDGLKSYFVRDAFSSSKKSTKKSAYFQPLTLLEIEANHKNKNTLEYFLTIKPLVYQSIPNDVVKSSLVLFLSEVFHFSIKEESKNEDLFLFLETALLWLDENEITTNFHLIVLLELTKFLGFYPNFSEENFFELTEGIFTDFQSKTCLNQEESTWFKLFLNQKIDSVNNPFSTPQRRRLLEIIMDYYTFHIEHFKKPKSLEVFKEVFS